MQSFFIRRCRRFFFLGGLLFYPQILQINADRCWFLWRRGLPRGYFFSHAKARKRERGGRAFCASWLAANVFFLTRRRESAKKAGNMAACLAAARQATPPAGRRERGGGRSVPRGLPRGYFFSREGAKKKARKIFSHAKARKREEDREDGGMSCRCASSHAAGRDVYFSSILSFSLR